MQRQNGPGRARTLASLVELVAAIDRRAPHVERRAERAIAREASELRAEASLRIERLRTALSRHDAARELSLSSAVMSDDGAPPTD